LLRRASQATLLGVAFIRALLDKSEVSTGVAGEQLERLWSSTRVDEHLQAPSPLKRFAGLLLRALLMRFAAMKKLSEYNDPACREFVLHLTGPINQVVLRNLLIWQSHMVANDRGRPVDIALVLRDNNGECRLFDLVSAALTLEWIRNISVAWSSHIELAIASGTERQLLRAPQTLSDLCNLPSDVISSVIGSRVRGGAKLSPEGRKRANDYLKVVLPNRFIVALGMLESADGDIERGELDRWLRWIADQHARDQRLGFVILNRVAPSQCSTLPDYVRVARWQGLSLQDTVCLAQIADTYVGVLDILGLTALSAGRPGVYLPMNAEDVNAADLSQIDAKLQKILVLSTLQPSGVETSERVTVVFQDLVAGIAS
jgi:hypothetical protein